MKKRRIPLLLVALVSVLLAIPGPLLAHGGGEPMLTREPVGDLLLYAWSTPTPPVAGKPLHITLALTRPAADGSETPITDATVTVLAVPASGETLSVKAVPGAAVGGFYYETDLTLSAGDWTIEVEVTPSGGSRGVASFAAAVEPAAGLRIWMIAFGAALVAAGIVLYAVALIRGRRKEPVVA